VSDAADWNRVKEVLHAALTRAPEERGAFLRDTCGADCNLQAEVESLLAAHAQAGSFAERPAIQALNDVPALADESFAGGSVIHDGDRLGTYQIQTWLGAGGMGEVYRARDTKLGRDVAIKVLPAAFSADPDRLRRFEQEARAAAALNHPNIVTIHSVEEANGIRFLTMELVEGRPLSELIPRDGMPLDRLLNIAIPLASALSVAHSKGITHRDLKPANIMVGAEGVVKILDFGLAKLRDMPPAGLETGLPTEPATAEGRIVGTVAYMSPQQAEGKAIDARSDLFSLGVILYELATGQRPFRGDTNLSVLSSIVKDTPTSVTDLRPRLPLELGRIINHCLVKDPEHRYQTAKDLRNELEELKQAIEPGTLRSVAGVLKTMRTGRRGWRVLGAVAIVVAAALTAGVYLLVRTRREVQPVVRPVAFDVSQLTSQPGMEQSPSLSPDGKWFVYNSTAAGKPDIYLQAVGGQLAINLTRDSPAADTEPAFSPDGESIAFRSERDGGGIFVMGRTGESTRRLTTTGFNPAWSPDGKELVYATGNTTFNFYLQPSVSQLWTLNLATGAPHRIGARDAMAQPAWSPHGSRIAYWGWNVTGQTDIWTIPAAGGPPVRVTNDPAVDWNPVWSPDGGYLYFTSDRSGSMNLWRVRIDERSGTPLGSPEPMTTSAPYVPQLSVSADGQRIAYTAFAAATGSSDIEKIGFDLKTMRVTSNPVSVTTGTLLSFTPDLSSDGQWVAFLIAQVAPLHQHIFIARPDGTGLRQLTRDAANHVFPRWSPDGKRLAFSSNPRGNYSMWTINPDGSDLRQVSEYGGAAPVWSPDGTRMAIRGSRARTFIFDPARLWTAQTPQVLPLFEQAGSTFLVWDWSPDGQWLAGVARRAGGPTAIVVYSLQAGRYEQLAELPPRRTWTIVPFGEEPAWLNDSRHLVFAFEKKLMLLDRTTRQMRELWSVAGENLSNARPSRDNRWIFFERGSLQSDIWLLTLK
jgi:Tol biopolymer transport system component